MTKEIIKLIEQQAALRGMKPSTLCLKAVNDGKLIERLRAGGTINLNTLQKLNEYFDAPIGGQDAAA